ncbi:DUF4238 domain-containing protein [Flavobacterium sp.]|uniref:DUF4238 domain-containing protein n=1 Tax=Flavobacterium sp. TaxID=239 RepID=UPI0031E3F618
MNNISWRHHYLPVFYLKGFTKESGKLKIYNVNDKRFIQNGKEFSPESYFFEKNANTLEFGDQSIDVLETEYYAYFDDKISKLIAKINASDHNTRYDVNEDDMPILNHFVSLMYWRLPHREKELKSIISENDLKSLGISIPNIGIDNTILEEKFKNSTEFLKSFKYYNSLLDTIRGINCNTPFSIIETHENFPYLSSDNPVIFEKKFRPKVFEDDYLFPLSGNRLFVKGKRKKDFPPYLRMLVDTLVYKQAIKYVSCTDENYIGMLDMVFERHDSIEKLKSYVFNIINDLNE